MIETEQDLKLEFAEWLKKAKLIIGSFATREFLEQKIKEI